MAFSDDEVERYARHLVLREVGGPGQQKLQAARVLIVGAGGLGAPAALYLAAAGVGHIGLIDPDIVSISNLQRQVLYLTADEGREKVLAAAPRLEALNPHVTIEPIPDRLLADSAADLVSEYDLVLDGTDNFPTRFLVNDASVKLGIPVVHGSIFRFEGQVTVFDPKGGPTYRDMLPEPPPAEMAPSCAEAGVLGVLPGIIGTIQAVEALKLILGVGDPLIGRYLTFDALDMEFREYKIRRDPNNLVTWDNRDQIQVVELEGLCQPAPIQAPA